MSCVPRLWTVSLQLYLRGIRVARRSRTAFRLGLTNRLTFTAMATLSDGQLPKVWHNTLQLVIKFSYANSKPDITEALAVYLR
jgi:hypothetical protein